MRRSSSRRKVVVISVISAAVLLLSMKLIRLTSEYGYSVVSSDKQHQSVLANDTTVQRAPVVPNHSDTIEKLPNTNRTKILTEGPAHIVCTESRAMNFTPFSRLRPLRQLSDFLVGPGLQQLDNDSGPAAVCEFNYEVGHNWFPHLMQQLYRCWSYWCVAVPFSKKNDTRKQQHKERVLLYDPKLAQGTKKTNFSDGILEALRDAAGVKIVTTYSSDAYNHSSAVTAKLTRDGKINHYAMLPGHGELLTNLISQHYSLAPGKAGCPLQQNSSNNVPRIAILNRKGSRKLLNADKIAQQILALLPNKTIVPVEYFEEKSFLEQVQFFRDTDILVAPHGAALTGTVFLPPCSYVMEIFPVGYDIPGFFGTLAVYSGHQHGYLTLTKTGNVSQEHAEARKSVAAHTRARGVQLCPPSKKIVDAVQQMIAAWRKCCSEKHAVVL